MTLRLFFWILEDLERILNLLGVILMASWIWMEWRSQTSGLQVPWITNASVVERITNTTSKRQPESQIPKEVRRWNLKSQKDLLPLMVIITNHKDSCIMHHWLSWEWIGIKEQQLSLWNIRWDWEENSFRPLVMHQHLGWVAIAGSHSGHDGHCLRCESKNLNLLLHLLFTHGHWHLQLDFLKLLNLF